MPAPQSIVTSSKFDSAEEVDRDEIQGTRKLSVGDAWGSSTLVNEVGTLGNGAGRDEDDEVGGPASTSTLPPTPTNLSSAPLAEHSAISPVDQETTPDSPPSKKDDDWGNHGDLDNLPPLPVVAASPSLSTTRDKEWGDANEWSPEAIPIPLPSFGDVFVGGRGGTVEEEEEEGWGGEKAVPDWDTGNSRREEQANGGDGEERSWDSEPPRATGGKSIVSGIWVFPFDSLVATNVAPKWCSPPLSWMSSKTILVDLRNRRGLLLQRNSEKMDSKKEQEQSEFQNSTIYPSVVSCLLMSFSLITRPPLLTSLLQAPYFSTSTGTTTSDPTDLPLSSLFRATPTLYPAFREGLDKTALRSTEVLKGASSAAARSARFGRAALLARNSEGRTKVQGPWDSDSPLSTPVLSSERGVAGDEFDLDQPGSGKAPATKSSWWGASSSASTSATTTNTPKSLLTKKELEHIASVEAKAAESMSDAGGATAASGPSVLGRLFGRGKKSNVVNAVDAENNPEWNGIEFLESGGSGNGERKKSGDPAATFDDPLDSVFNKPLERSNSPLDYNRPIPGDDFGRLAPIKSTATKSKGKAVSLDPFDPFADDEEDDFSRSSTPPIAPVARMLPPSLIPSSRSMSPLHSASPTFPSTTTSSNSSNVISFPPLIVPQSHASSATGSEFDNFFNSVKESIPKPTPPPQSSSSLPPPLAPSPVVSVSPIKPSVRRPSIQTKPVLPPPSLRPSSSQPKSPLLQPPPASGSPSLSNPSSFFPAPPPPSQPLRNFVRTPPPPPPPPPASALLSTKSGGLAPPVLPGSLSNRPPAPRQTSAGGGPLSMDDLSFFESL